MRQNKLIFKLNTQKIIYISILLAIYLVLSLLAKVIPPIFLGFLKIEFTDFIFLFAFDIINWFYSLILIIMATWLRFLYLPEDPVGLTALMISDIIMLMFFILLRYLFSILLFRVFKNKSAKIKTLSINIIAVVLATILTASTMVLFNYLFILKWYAYLGYMPLNKVDEYKSYLVHIFLPFNLIKFSINSFLYIIIFPLTWELQKSIRP